MCTPLPPTKKSITRNQGEEESEKIMLLLSLNNCSFLDKNLYTLMWNQRIKEVCNNLHSLLNEIDVTNYMWQENKNKYSYTKRMFEFQIAKEKKKI